jgi:hypothetical protein
MKSDDFRHITAFKPNQCIQIDMFTFGKRIAYNYKIAEWYTIALDVYSRYMVIRVNTDKNGKLPINSKGHLFTNFVETLNMFLEYPEMIVADAEYDTKEIRKFCRDNNIKLYVLPTGSVNANNIAERAIRTVKNLFRDYIIYYNDEILERLENENIDIIKNSYKIINSIVYYYNRSFHTMIKGIPIEIYLGFEGSNLPLGNFNKYPEFEVGQYVYAFPRGRFKSFAFQQKKLTRGIPGQIIARPSKSVYTIKTDLKPPNHELNLKWYEFVPISEAEFNKLKSIPLFK